MARKREVHLHAPRIVRARRERAQIREDGERVVIAHRLGVRRVRHDRKERRPIAADPLAHRAHDLTVAPRADADPLVAREVSRADATGEDVGKVAEVSPDTELILDLRLTAIVKQNLGYHGKRIVVVVGARSEEHEFRARVLPKVLLHVLPIVDDSTEEIDRVLRVLFRVEDIRVEIRAEPNRKDTTLSLKRLENLLPVSTFLAHAFSLLAGLSLS